MNGGFAWLLRELGFAVTLMSARVARKGGGMGPEFDHLTLRVDLDEPWLADVGFGDSFIEPLPLKPDIVSGQIGRKFRLTRQDAGERWQMEEFVEETWKPQYSFTQEPRALAEFADMCHYHQTSPDSHFTRKRVCTLATLTGRITLIDLKLVIKKGTDSEERTLASEEEWNEVLRRDFGVQL
jgi:N-hydroxyarylamine O-acetyltransferase